MKAIAAQFTKDMEQIRHTVETVKASFDLARHDISGFRSRHTIAVATKTVHAAAKTAGSTAAAYDGAYLATCALFEQFVRSLVERFILTSQTTFTVYGHLPEAIRKWHSLGCAYLLTHLDHDTFAHLTETDVLRKLSSCLNSSIKRPYQLSPEAFSYCERNMRPEVIEDLFNHRLGLSKVWQKLSRNTSLQGLVGSPQPETVERVLRERLRGAIVRRNSIVHRGRSYYSASESEIIETSKLFEELSNALALCLDAYLIST